MYKKTFAFFFLILLLLLLLYIYVYVLFCVYIFFIYRYLTNYDCVTFNSFLEAIITSNSSSTTVKQTKQSQWLFLDAADRLIKVSNHNDNNMICIKQKIKMSK